MAVDYRKQVEAFKDTCKAEAETLVNDTFPQKVLQLNKLLESEMFDLKALQTIQCDLNIPVPEPVPTQNSNSKKRKVDISNDIDIPGSLVYALPNGQAPANPKLVVMIAEVKPHIRALIDATNQIKMWIQYLIPRIEDGNNFGVSIQEDVLSEARQVESEAATYLDQLSRYHMTRAKIISKVAKYPHVEDYRITVRELDEKEFVSLRLIVSELRNHYCSLHDVIFKNLEKIKKPKNSNADNMF